MRLTAAWSRLLGACDYGMVDLERIVARSSLPHRRESRSDDTQKFLDSRFRGNDIKQLTCEGS